MCIAAGACDKVKATFSQAAYLIIFLGLGVNTDGIAAVPRHAKPYTTKIGIKDLYNTIRDLFELFIETPRAKQGLLKLVESLQAISIRHNASFSLINLGIKSPIIVYYNIKSINLQFY